MNQPGKYQRLLDLVPSPANGLEFCLGTLQEMTEGDVYEALDRYSRQGKIAYVHFRNVQRQGAPLPGSVRRRGGYRHAPRGAAFSTATATRG